MYLQIIYLIYKRKQDYLVLNNQQWLMCHKTKTNQTKLLRLLFLGYHFINISAYLLSSLLVMCHIIAERFFILSFFVGYILSFGLVRLRTIRLSARVGAKIKRRCSRSRREDVTITDVIIKILDRKCDWGCEWRYAGSDGLRILGDFWKKKTVSWDLNLDEASWFLDLGEASPVGSTRCAARCGVRWNRQHSKNSVSLSSCWKPKSQGGVLVV